MDENATSEAELLDRLTRCLEIQRELIDHYRAATAWRKTLARTLHETSACPARDLLSICKHTLLSD